MFQTIENESNYDLTEKKSKFIACLMYVRSKDEAEIKIKEFKKKYHDARHNCSAYRVLEDSVIYEKSSDDGEPFGTAGAPMLNILQKNNLCNVLIIVTRYFGGILLGTGGLVRCYSDATIGAIKKAKKFIIKEGTEFEVEIDYNYFEAFKYYCSKRDINILNVNYSEKIICNIEVENEISKGFLEDVKDKKICINGLRLIGRKDMFLGTLPCF